MAVAAWRWQRGGGGGQLGGGGSKAEVQLWQQHEYAKTFFNSDVHMEGWRRYEVLGVIFVGVH